jgi:Gti1/Pac2 family transcription factor
METYHGYVRTTLDALILFEACRLGALPRAQRRLSEKERKAISSGSVFVWDEREAGMRRWTDGKSWSASRVSGSFLTYREMEGKRPDAPEGYNPDFYDGDEEKKSDDESKDQKDSQPEGFRYKPDGLMKQSFSITTSTHLKLHLISYFSKSSINDLPIPSRDPNLKHINIPKGLYPDHAAPVDQPGGPHVYPLFQQPRLEVAPFSGQVQQAAPLIAPGSVMQGSFSVNPIQTSGPPPIAAVSTMPGATSVSSGPLKTAPSPLSLASPQSTTTHYYATGGLPGVYAQPTQQALQPQPKQLPPHLLSQTQQPPQQTFSLPPLAGQVIPDNSPLQSSTRPLSVQPVAPSSAPSQQPLSSLAASQGPTVPLQYEPAVPRVASLGAADIPMKKVMWGEDARAINVLDRRLNF